MVLQTASKNGWFWYIPQHNNMVSVGVVAPLRLSVQESRQSANYEQTYCEEVERVPGGEAACQRRAGERPAIFATKDYSYRATKVAGDGWVMIGDAWGFLDPLYSSGVLLALKSGELAADAIVEGLASGDTSAAQLGKWGDLVQRRRRPHATVGLRVLRWIQLRKLRPPLSGFAAAR